MAATTAFGSYDVEHMDFRFGFDYMGSMCECACVVFLCRAYLMRFGGLDMCTFAHKLPCLHRHAARKVNSAFEVALGG